MCVIVKYLNNLDTEDLIIFINLLALCLGYGASTGNPFRRLALVNKYPCQYRLHSSIIQNSTSPTLMWILTHYTVRNILFEATIFERTSFFEVRVSHNIVFTTVLLSILIVIGHVTLRRVLCAGWSGSAFSAVHGSLHGVGDFSKIFHFEIILPISH